MAAYIFTRKNVFSFFFFPFRSSLVVQVVILVIRRKVEPKGKGSRPKINSSCFPIYYSNLASESGHCMLAISMSVITQMLFLISITEIANTPVTRLESSPLAGEQFLVLAQLKVAEVVQQDRRVIQLLIISM